MLEPIGLIARLDRLGRASRAQSTRCVHTGFLILCSTCTSRQDERQFKRACASSAEWAAARPRGARGNPPPPPGPPGKRRQSKAALRGRGGQPGVPNILYPLRFTQKRVRAFMHRKEGSLRLRPLVFHSSSTQGSLEGSLEAAPRTHTRSARRRRAFCPVS